ncbi:MAG: ATP-dependent RecD-like DNA helicase [Anaerolineaceae bacterium]|nr:ATP-dependent RecD-like DNA helicase [Anaerolineaceae bacterium]
MNTLWNGAKILPLRHLSIRVPWNDTNWSGVICEKPGENISCLVLPRISETRNDEWETTHKCKHWDQLPDGKFPACVGEHGNFMAPFEITRNIIHPYSENGGTSHKHFRPTPLRYPPYSAACIPYRWMLKNSVEELLQTYSMHYQQDFEDQSTQNMGFKTSWIQAKYNQLAMLDTFFSAIKPQSSLCIFYAKRTPFFEDNRRVIIGIGIVEHVGDFTEYNYSEPGQIQSVLWERMIQHSIRPGMKNGFVLPYQQLKSYLDAHPEENPESYVAYAADEYLDAFSYGTEHVTNDVAIAALLSCSKALNNMKTILPGQWDKQIQWIDQQLNLLWKMRGPYPGLGAALSAFGCENGTLFALEIERIIAEKAPDQMSDPWIYVDEIFSNPTSYNLDTSVKIGDTIRKKWQNLPDERKTLLKLLSRFAITSPQATRFYIHEDKSRGEANIHVDDKQILENPYLLYELDRFSADPISASIIDRGVFPDVMIREQFPIPEPSCVSENIDERRVRAFIIRQLEEAADNGNSVYSREKIIQEIRELDVQPTCPVDSDLLTIIEDSFSTVIHRIEFANDQPGYQLDKLHQAEGLIRKTVQGRINGKRHSAEINWRQLLDFALKEEVDPNDEQEIKARQEKTIALKELFESRISVLIGPAGTGKTTLLQVLCNEPSVKLNGLLMLAPTGKARVRMEAQTKIHNAKTIAQFLLPLDRYDPLTGRYHPSTREKIEVGKTIIIDEASMLTEEQLAAVFDAIKGVDRFILVGDPRQLPPIGAGRPFLDIVNLLSPDNVESLFPKIGVGYTELTIRRRQKGENRRDLILAEWFSGRPVDPGADIIWGNPNADMTDKTLRLVSWEHTSEFQNVFLKVLVEELALDSNEDWKKFELSLGGTLYNDLVYFNSEYRDRPGSSRKIEDWQILSPVRADTFGVIALNRFVQNQFRFKTKEFASNTFGRRIPKPMGREGILYGDKVIQVKNQRRWGVFPKDGSQQYVANGEIGIAVGQFKGSKAKYKGLPWQLEVEFSTQTGFKYNYGDSDFGEEMEAPLELAYALTVHKTQGSEFKKTFVVIPNPCRLLSRELLYTALTRQQEKVIILHQGEFHDLKRYSDDYYSEAASRLTNTFCPPNPIVVNDRFLEANLIHRTRRGESVRSKSEVIIANILFEKHIDYVYEQALIINNGIPKYPDFTIEDSDSGITYYWEHLGMLMDPIYKQRWENKLNWYKSHNILPIEDGGGENGTLIITKDALNGGIDSKAIEELIISSFS